VLCTSERVASAQAPGAGARTLEEGWRFAPGARARPPARGWRPVAVPHVFEAKPRPASFAGGIGWYRLRFRVPRASAAVGWDLHFAAARRRADVWLNGRHVGRSRAPYAPFWVRAHGVRRRRANELLVRVDNRRPAGLREGWWNWGGLTRPVSLVPVGRVVLRDVAVLPDVRCTPAEACTAAVELSGRAHNRAGAPIDASVGLRLTAPSGRQHATTVPLALPARDSRTFRTQLAIAGVPELWSPARPQLHDAGVHLASERGREAQVNLRVGLRSVRVAGEQLLLNGAAVRLRGASIHEDLPGRGAALRDRDIERIVGDLRALGATVTRAHYPLDERLLRRLDELGILVWNQAPVYHADRDLVRRGGVARALAALRAAVANTRNHPSVVVHSVANELTSTPDAAPATNRYITRAAAYVRALDPSVPSALDIMGRPNYPPQRTYAAVQALGLNVYFGWYGGPDAHSVAEHRDLAPYLATTRAQYPGHALVVSEFGAEADRRGPASVKRTYAFQAGYISRTLDVIEQARGIGGAIYWTLREFAIRPGWVGGGGGAGRHDTIHNKGLLTYHNRRKPAWFVAQRRFTTSGIAARSD
jgi:Glycosyl hydrolases family 2, TIM barrel domain/Glycosyl hydrolases family 2